MPNQLTTSVTQLSQSVSSPWAFAEPLFVFWLDIVYNERWLVNLFKCLCYFSLCRSAIHPSRPSPTALTHPPTWVTFFRGVWARVRGYYWAKGSSHRVQVQLHVTYTLCSKWKCEFHVAIIFSWRKRNVSFTVPFHYDMYFINCQVVLFSVCLFFLSSHFLLILCLF